MKRRTFIGNVTTAIAAGMLGGWSALLVGCNWASDLLNWIPVGLSAVSSILSLLAGAGIVLGPGVYVTISLVQAGLTDLRLAIVEYQSTTPPPAGALAKIDAFLADLVNNLGNLVNQLPIGTSTVITLVVGLVELILSTIQGFIGKMPMSAAMSKTQEALKRGLVLNGRAVTISPATDLSRRHFIKTYNHLVDAGGHHEAQLPLSLVQHL